MQTAHITATYMDHHGDDLLVVNAARASFEKSSWWADAENKILKPADARLIRYLATGYRTREWDEFLFEIIETVKSNEVSMKSELTDLLHAYKRRAQHWAPFGHPHVTLRVTLPIFLARQFAKHQVGGTVSEASRRYISDEPSYWIPGTWHTRPEDVKQGSGDPVHDQHRVKDLARGAVEGANETYLDLLDEGVAPEEARMVLPLNMMTTVVWTGSLLFWSRVYNQRAEGHAQLAAQHLAHKIGAIVAPLYPVSWKALTS
jgi:thymidylate synthase (FAD)